MKYMKKSNWTKARIFRWTLGISGWVFCLIMAFVIEQYYRWEVSNFVSRDGEPHTYNIYEGTSIDSLMAMIEEDYEIVSFSSVTRNRATMCCLRRSVTAN